MHNKNNIRTGLMILVLGLAFMTGCTSIPEGQEDPNDPFESFNRSMYSFNDTLDQMLIKPIAQGYNALMPKPVNKGITNFFSNLNDVVVVFNDLLQFKFEQAVSDATRIVWNSTIGILGFIDVASHMDLEKHNEDFGQTLGYWGFGEGAYVVWPIFGPNTLRDTVGDVVDYYVADPISYVEPDKDRYWLLGVKAIDKRADLLSASKVLEEAALDPYVFTRDAFLQRRRNLVHDGNPPKEDIKE
jgi:phospholipid-binding lipoprotein MlaA